MGLGSDCDYLRNRRLRKHSVLGCGRVQFVYPALFSSCLNLSVTIPELGISLLFLLSTG